MIVEVPPARRICSRGPTRGGARLPSSRPPTARRVDQLRLPRRDQRDHGHRRGATKTAALTAAWPTFSKTAVSGWTQVAKLVPADAAGSDGFGSSVAISGATLLVGAPGDDDHVADSGSAYLFDATATSRSPDLRHDARGAARVQRGSLRSEQRRDRARSERRPGVALRRRRLGDCRSEAGLRPALDARRRIHGDVSRRGHDYRRGRQRIGRRRGPDHDLHVGHRAAGNAARPRSASPERHGRQRRRTT